MLLARAGAESPNPIIWDSKYDDVMEIMIMTMTDSCWKWFRLVRQAGREVRWPLDRLEVVKKKNTLLS